MLSYDYQIIIEDNYEVRVIRKLFYLVFYKILWNGYYHNFHIELSFQSNIDQEGVFFHKICKILLLVLLDLLDLDLYN